jgi:HK97 family phage portal protein
VNGYKLSPEAAAIEARNAASRGSIQAAAVDSAAVIAGGGDIFEWFGGGGRAAGVNVTPESAMRATAVWRCVTLIAGRLMTAPLCVYERTPSTPIKLPDHDLTRFLQVEPNDFMSAAEFIELQTMAMLLRGNGYGLIRQARNGVIHDVDYYHPARVMPYWSGNARWYRFTNLDGSTEDVDDSRTLHFKGPGLSWDGLRALSPIQHHAQAIGIGLAARDYTAKQFEQGLLTNEYFSFNEEVTEQQRADFKEYLRKRVSGLNGAHNPLLLEKGGKWDRLGVSAKDAQLLELLQYSAIDIARIFGVPPHLVGEVDKSTSWGTGIEQQNLGFDGYTLLPHRERFAGELTRKFFPVVGRQLPKYFIDFDPTAQLRGDMKARGEFSRVALGGNQLPGFMSRNEVRASFGLPPIDGGDEVYWPNGDPADPETPAEDKKEGAGDVPEAS